MHSVSKIVFSCGLIILGGCHLGPDYHTPYVEAPDHWKIVETPAPIPTVEYWWEVFEDDTLNNLELYALQNNPNLYVALERVIEARAAAGVSRANLFPQLNLEPSYTNSMSLTRFQLPSGLGLPITNTPFRIQQINGSLPFDLSYQLDLWGMYRGQYDSAVFSAEAEADAYYAALLTLTSDLASAYYQMRALDAQVDLLIATKNVRKDAQDVNQARWEAGLVNYTDVTRARLEYTNAESQLYDAMRQRNRQENQIAVLVGMNATSFALPHSPLISSPPHVPATIPSVVLLNRPDIAQAEREMASQHALIGVAYAAFLPQISLTGTLGHSSPTLQDFFTWKSRLWSYGVNVVQNLFDGGRNNSNLDESWARFNQTTGTYQNQVLIAFREVEDALSDIQLQSLQYASLEHSVESAKLTTLLSTDRYNRGLVNYLDVVDSERAELEVEITAINLLGARYLSTIQLIKSLGGTWESPLIETEELSY